jgi:iron complex transport system ATP-binding protein
LNKGQLVADGQPNQILTTELLADVFGVCTDINPHPQHQIPHITYYYGYENSDKDSNECGESS